MLLRMLVVLWCVRGLFTREIIYNPCFAIAMGLVVGLCLLAEQSRRASLDLSGIGSKSGANIPKPLPGRAG